MVFNDVTDIEKGLIQGCEFWTRHSDGDISGASILLKQFTGRLNRAFDKIMPLLLAYNDTIRWDDTVNHTDKPIGYVDIVANQNDYLISADDNGLDILNVTNVRAIAQTGDTQYVDLRRIVIGSNDARDHFHSYNFGLHRSHNSLVPEILNPNTAITGQPRGYIELGNRIFLDILPEANVTNGLEITFQRQQSVFASTDTTKEPGIPLPFHELLVLYASLDWNSVNRTDDTNLLTILRDKIAVIENDLDTFISLRNPAKATMQPRGIFYL